MPRLLTWLLVSLLSSAGWLAAQTTAPAPTSKATHAKRSKARAAKSARQEAPVAAQLPPPPPPTPEQMPAVPPQVTYSNGLLSVNAQNSTLGDIFSAVHRQMGASIELPPGVGSERVAARLGPAPAKDVISSLLTGSNFNYIILGSDAQPDGVQRVIVTARAGAAPLAGAPPSNPPGPLGVQNRIPTSPEPEPDTADEESAQEIQQEEQAQPGQFQPAIGQQPAPVPGQPQPLPPDQNAQGQPGDQQNQVRTPEQMLQELQRMQRLNQPNGQPPQNPQQQPQ